MGNGQSNDPFVKAVDYVIDVLEGGDKYTNDPNDAGGATRYGISRRAYPDLDIATLTRDRAIRIYHDDYWLPSKADALPAPLALQYFAAAVNIGQKSSARCLQQALGVTVDGWVGPKTLAAVRAFRPQSELRARFSREWLRHYEAIVARYPYNLRWLYGWQGRVCRVADEAGRWDGMS